MSEEKQQVLDVVIIGAGVAGLAAAYGLNKPEIAHLYNVRIFERRTVLKSEDAGYPIHLSPPGRRALEALLSPSDWAELDAARKSLPTRHDGITVLSSRGKRVWHTIREPGQSCMVERGEVCRILNSGVDKVEYGRRVISAHEYGERVELMMDDGEVLHADILIAADGMFSTVRKVLHVDDGFAPVKYTTINIRASPAMRRFVRDPFGMNVLYGKGWSAALIPLEDGVYIPLTVPRIDTDKPVQEILAELAPAEFIDALRQDPSMEAARPFPLHTGIRTVTGVGRIVLIGDAAHGMVPFCGAGASASMHDAYELVRMINEAADLDRAIKTFNKKLKKRNDPIIKASGNVLWLAQGATAFDRFIRGTAFRAINAVESALWFRERAEKELQAVVLAEKLKKLQVSSDSDIDSSSRLHIIDQ